MKQVPADRDFPNITGGLLIGFLTLVTPWAIIEWAGIGDDVERIMRVFDPFRGVTALLIYAGTFVVIGGVARGIAAFLGLAAFTGNRATDAIGQVIASGGWFVIAQLRSLILPLEIRFHETLMRLQEEIELWRQYRAEFRSAYASFAEFKRAFYGEDEPDDAEEPDAEPQPEPARRDSLKDAFELMGLSDQCTEAEFKARYRELMMLVHPDKSGTNSFATQLNLASDLIRKMKGWN